MSATTVIEIKARAKVKTLAYSAAISVAGMIIMGLTAAFAGGDGALTVGIILAGLGIGLVMMAQEQARKASVTARLNDEGFLLSSSRTNYGLEWKDVRRVSMGTNQITIRDAKGQEGSVLAPPGAGLDELEALAAEMVKRLDASRGYAAES